MLVRGDHQVVAVTRSHEPHYQYLRAELAPGCLVVQPSNRGTGPGIVYSLLRILELTGNVPVAILPSDHYVADDSEFMGYVARALSSLNGVPYALVLLGVKTQASPSYTPDFATAATTRSVMSIACTPALVSIPIVSRYAAMVSVSGPGGQETFRRAS